MNENRMASLLLKADQMRKQESEMIRLWHEERWRLIVMAIGA